MLAFSPAIRSSTPGAFVLAAGAEPSPGYRLRRVRGRGGFAERLGYIRGRVRGP